MREIKFRAWVDNKRMVDFEHIWSRWDVCDLFDAVDTIPMQYTGIKDKNGREIYEGYIVICLSEKSYFGKIGEKCAVEFNNDWACFAPFSYYDSEWNVYNYPEYFEVIGNIYENPELLKEIE